MDQILRSLVNCHILQPLAERLWVVCPIELQSQLTSLLKKRVLPALQSARVIGAQLPEASLQGCINAFARSSGHRCLDKDASLLILDACSFCSWPTTIQRFLAHSLLRNETCIARVPCTSWAGLIIARLSLSLEDDSYNARVTAVQPSSGPPHALSQEIVVCPILCIPSHRLAETLNAAAASRNVLQMFTLLLKEPVFSLPIDGCLWLGPEGLQLLQAYANLVRYKTMRLPPAKHPSAALEAECTVQQEALQVLSEAVSSGQPLNFLTASSNPSAEVIRESPAIHLAAQHHKPRLQHPVFSTSNNAYGSKAPSPLELPLSWHGIRGDFTRTQATGKTVTTGLKTAISNHAVADVLHEIGL